MAVKKSKSAKLIVRVTVEMSDRPTKSAVRDMVQTFVDKMVGERIGSKVCISAKAGAVDEQ